MKNYRLLAPILLIALFALGVYMCGSSNVKTRNRYNQYIEDARAYAEQKIEIYALENYQNALNMQPSLALYREVAEFYRDIMENRGKAAEWGEVMLTQYPKLPEPYEFQMDIYLRNEDYAAFFDLYHTMVNRHISSEAAESLYKSVEYVYYEQGEYDEASIFSNNLAPVRRNENWGYCNSKGKKKIGTVYTYAGAFSDGMAPVIDAAGEAYFIDNNGNKVMSVEVEENIQKLGVMSSAEIYTVFNGKEWNYYKKSGELLMGGFSEAANFANGVTAAKTGSSWKIYDTSGNTMTDTAYPEVVMDEKQMVYRNERLFVGTGSSYIMIDAQGGQIGTDTYEDVRIFYENTYAAVRKDGKWGFIDKDGSWFIEPEYEDARSFLNGYAAVKLDGKWGFINMEKELCIHCAFTEAKDFTQNGTALICRNQTWSVLLLYKNNY